MRSAARAIYRWMQRCEQGGLDWPSDPTDPNRALIRSTPGSRIGSSPCAGRTPRGGRFASSTTSNEKGSR